MLRRSNRLFLTVIMSLALALPAGCDSGNDDSEQEDRKAAAGDATEDVAQVQFKGVDNGDGTITDLTTDLMWEKGCSPWIGWSEAVERCSGLGLAGHDDWRLPDIDELRSLISVCPQTMVGGACNVSTTCVNESECFDGACYLPACEGLGVGTTGCFLDPLFTAVCMESVNPGPGCEYLWSTTHPSEDGDRAFRLDFEDAIMTTVGISSDSSARCVRDE